jgi:TATA-box binding protein (TBP) (component of TFIID and TFIIIB)
MKMIAGALGGCYDGDIFPPCVIRFINPKVTCGVFPTGKIVACGAPHQDIAMLGMYKVIEQIGELFGEMLRLIDFHLENIVMSARLPYELDLALYHADYLGTKNYTIYYPCKFPGIHQFFGPVRPCLVIFDTGAILVTGIRTPKEASDIVARIPFHMWQRGHTYRKLVDATSVEKDLVAEFASLSTKDQKKESKQRLANQTFRQRNEKLTHVEKWNLSYNHWAPPKHSAPLALHAEFMTRYSDN